MIADHIFRRDVFDPPSLLERVLRSPVQFLVYLIYRFFNALHVAPRRPPPRERLRVVCISDTHTRTYDIPDGDLLIHAGDLTDEGTTEELQAHIDWLASFPHQHKIAIAGNHDTFLDQRARRTLSIEEQEGELNWRGIRYLQHSTATLKFDNDRELRVYGAPQIPKCGGSNFAFQYERGLDAWSDTLPSRIDILVTHTPPRYHRDLMHPFLGCEFLLQEVWKSQPLLHVFGHVHGGAGKETAHWGDMQAAYEKSMARQSCQGVIRQLFSIRLWSDAVRVAWHGLIGVIWDQVWGGDVKGTVMVNAALMKNNTGRLGNRVQVIEI